MMNSEMTKKVARTEPKRAYVRRDAETPIDRFVRLYVEMPACERVLAMAALRGADLAMGKGARANGMDSTPEVQGRFEELGRAAVEDNDGN